MTEVYCSCGERLYEQTMEGTQKIIVEPCPNCTGRKWKQGYDQALKEN